MRIFLAGATGAIGRLLLPMLVEAGHEVIGTTRRSDRAKLIRSLGGTPVVNDALDRDAVFEAVNAARPDVIIHQLTDLAGRDFAANSRLRIEGTRNLVDAARATGVQRMIAQSISWVCIPGDAPSHEDEPLDIDASPPRRETIAAVQSLERATAELPVGIVLRYGILYGQGTWYERDGLTTEQIRRGEVKANDAITSFVHVADAARAALLALEWDGGVYNIVDDEPAAARDWVPLYASLVGAPPPPVEAGRQAWQRGESNEKARSTGWQARFPTWREGFRQGLG